MRIVEAGLPYLGRLNRVLGRAGAGLALVFLAAMTAVILLQVFFRYVLNAPLSWPEEAARYMMVWMTFLAAPLAYREGRMVRLGFVPARLPRNLLRPLEVALHAVIVVTVLVLFRESVWLVGEGAVMAASALPIHMNVVFAVLPVSFMVMAAIGLEKIAALWTGQADPMDEIVLAAPIGPAQGR